MTSPRTAKAGSGFILKDWQLAPAETSHLLFFVFLSGNEFFFLLYISTPDLSIVERLVIPMYYTQGHITSYIFKNQLAPILTTLVLKDVQF